MKKIKTIERIISLFDKSRAEKLPKNIPLMLRSRAQTYPDFTLQVVKNEIGEYESQLQTCVQQSYRNGMCPQKDRYTARAICRFYV